MLIKKIFYMREFCLAIFIILLFNACAINNQNINSKPKDIHLNKINELRKEIISLSNKIDKEEARRVSTEAIIYSKHLANEYKIVKPALFHNTLINLNLKEKGYCYHYANDLMEHLKEKEFKSFYFIRAVSNKGEYFEHSSLVLTRDDISFNNSIVLDAWRNAGELFFSKVKDDKKYEWEIK